MAVTSRQHAIVLQCVMGYGCGFGMLGNAQPAYIAGTAMVLLDVRTNHIFHCVCV